MTGSFLWWALLAVILFWWVGVYNRLMRIRARGLDALGSVEKHLKVYGVIVQALLASQGDALSPPWRELADAVDNLDAACKRARTSPLASEPMAALTASWDGVQHAWRALQSLPADLAGAQIPDAIQGEWDETTQKAHIAKGGYNQIAARYNDALVQFPARLVAAAMGFQRVGTL